MKRYCLTFSIIAVFVAVVYLGRYSIDTRSSHKDARAVAKENGESPSRVERRPNESLGFEQQTTIVDSHLYHPSGRFENYRVIDKKATSTKEEDGTIIVHYLLESDDRSRSVVYLEEHYRESLAGEAPTPLRQYSAVGHEVIFDADPLKIDISELESYLDALDGFVSRKSRLSNFIQIKLRSPSIDGYLGTIDKLRKRYPDTVVSRDDLHFTSAQLSEYSSALHWHLDQINAADAWQFSTGSEEIVVGVIDTGCFVGHPDLRDNIFVNTGEIPENGIDDDGNGFVDDVNGWDFVDDDAVANDQTGHGTHVSGIVGA